MIDLQPSLTWANDFNDFEFEDSVTYTNRNSDRLIIVAGDSWTYGDSLDPDLRLKQVYGNLISEQLGSDLINIGFKGWSNSWILHYTNWLIQNQEQQLSKYKKVIVVVTLTENARDVKSPNSFPFNYIDAYKEYGATESFYQHVLSSIQQHWCRLIDQIKTQHTIDQVLVASNFVWHDVEQLQNTDNNWIEVIAQQANYARPVRTNMVTGWIFDDLKLINDIAGVKNLDVYKNFVLPYIDKANRVNAWLDSSEYNGKKASKHPDYRAHVFWADYLLTYIEDKL